SRLGAARLHVLGTGEFLHVPARVALELGEGTTVSATTRSPIVVCDRPDYPVRSGIAFAATDGSARVEYAYNLRAGEIDGLVVVTDDPAEALAPLVGALCGAGLPRPLVVAVEGADG
ncbi:MAG TPA: TRSP domain-containing protein, partial [Candidatus Dormibacteraeota bacterium]|nr:TRSP domain-containing protein [Candidatus Dormibacteraeota bacterium]